MTILDDLNEAVAEACAIQHIAFSPEADADAQRWFARKHLPGLPHEPGTIAAMLMVSKHRPVTRFFDAGAHYGYFSLIARQLWPEATLTAFEMHPGMLETLSRNLEMAGGETVCVHGALSDAMKEDTLIWVSGFNIFEKPEGGWDKLETIPGAMKERGKGNRGRGFARVDFITLDAFCEAHGDPDLIKIDVEGFQARAVEGGLAMFSRAKPPIVIELHDPEKLARFGTTNAATVKPLLDLGYTGYWCGNFRDADARFEAVPEMRDYHEKLSIMVFVP